MNTARQAEFAPESLAENAVRLPGSNIIIDLFRKTGVRRIKESAQISPSHNKAPRSNFVLFDLLVDLAKESHSPQELAIEQEAYQKLHLLLRMQLKAALKEHWQLPYSAEVYEVDLDAFTRNELTMFHQHYGKTDLLDFANKSVLFYANDPKKRDRFLLERSQVQELYKRLWEELTGENFTSNLTESTVGQVLSDEARAMYGLHNIHEPVWVGQKHAYVMPQTEVHKGNNAYVNLHQVVFLPQRNRILVTTDQYYRQLSYSDLSEILETWQTEVPWQHDELPINEQVLMSTFVTLPEEVRQSQAYQIFATVAQKFERKGQVGFAADQQIGLGTLTRHQRNIHNAATFWTEILIAEYLTCQRNPAALTHLPERLLFATEIALKPLFDQDEFQLQVSKELYQQTFLDPLQKKSSKTRLFPTTLSQKLEQLQTQRDRIHQLSDTKFMKTRNQAVLELAKTYPGILSQTLSQAQCAAGALGGVTKLAETVQSSLGQQVLSGKLLGHSELAQLIGQDRAAQWKMGQCINPNCNNRGVEQLVGECSLCYRCELEHQLGIGAFAENSEGDDTDIADWLASHHASGEEATSRYRDRFLMKAGVLLPWMLAGDRVLGKGATFSR